MGVLLYIFFIVSFTSQKHSGTCVKYSLLLYIYICYFEYVDYLILQRGLQYFYDNFYSICSVDCSTPGRDS